MNRIEESEHIIDNKKQLPTGFTMRKDGRYQARFTYQGIRYTLYDKDFKTLKKKFADAKYELEHGIYQKNSTLSLNSWFQIWIKEYKQISVKASTLTSYTSNYERYIQSTLGKNKISDIKTMDLQKVYNKMLSNGLSTGTIQVLNAIMFNLFKQALKNDLITKNPAENIDLPKNQNPERRVMTMYEQHIFLEAIESTYYQPLYILALGTGLRIGEITALMWDDIDFKAKTLSVNKTLLYIKDSVTGKFSFLFQTPKSKSSRRIIPLFDDLVELLKHHMIQELGVESFENLKFVNSHKKRTYTKHDFSNLVFTTRNKTPIQEVYLLKGLATITDKINASEKAQARLEKREPIVFEPITPHTLRHTFATRAFENGLTPKTVQELLGHSSLSMTMDLYTHVTHDIKVKEMNKLSNMFQLNETFI